MSFADLVDLNSVALASSPMFARDCAFPITNMYRFCPQDDVVRNMPIFIGSWADGMLSPLLTGREFDVDYTEVTTECDSAIVSAHLTGCVLVAPDQEEVSLETEVMKWTDLVPEFCRMRNINPNNLGIIFNSDMSINTGNPYAIDFARWALAILSQVMIKYITRNAMVGDNANPNQWDGLITQLDNGWTQGTPSCGNDFNRAVVLDWAAATGVASPTPDTPVKAGGYAWTVWGTSFTIPEGLNLAQVIEMYWIDAVNKTWAETMGGVTQWEAWVHTGQGKCLPRTAQCMTACGATFQHDAEFRERYSRFVNPNVVQLFPSLVTFPMWESSHVPTNTMYFGPREIAGVPTYATVFKNLDEVLTMIGGFGNTYGNGFGLERTEPLIPIEQDYLAGEFENVAIYYDFTKVNMKCVKAGMLTKAGTLATARHLWLKVTGVNCATMVAACDDDITEILPEEE